MSGSDGTGRIYISVQEWYEFLKKHMPFPASAEFVMSPPRVDVDGEGGIEIDYAYSTDCYPGDWADGSQPQWLKDMLKGGK